MSRRALLAVTTLALCVAGGAVAAESASAAQSPTSANQVGRPGTVIAIRPATSLRTSAGKVQKAAVATPSPHDLLESCPGLDVPSTLGLATKCHFMTPDEVQHSAIPSWQQGPGWVSDSFGWAASSKVGSTYYNCTAGDNNRVGSTWTHTVGMSDSLGISVKLETELNVGIWEIKSSVETSYRHSWDLSDSYGETDQIDLPGGFEGWIDRADVMEDLKGWIKVDYPTSEYLVWDSITSPAAASATNLQPTLVAFSTPMPLSDLESVCGTQISLMRMHNAYDASVRGSDRDCLSSQLNQVATVTDCNSTDSQNFYLSSLGTKDINGNSLFYIVNSGNLGCLDSDGGYTTQPHANSAVVTDTCAPWVSGNTQVFVPFLLPDGKYWLVQNTSGLCLDAMAYSTATLALQHCASNAKNEEWSFR